MAKSSDRRTRIAAYFQRAQEQYGTPNAAATAYGTNRHTWAKLVAGEIPRVDARAAIIAARGWPEDAFQRIASGADPDEAWEGGNGQLAQVLAGIERMEGRLEFLIGLVEGSATDGRPVRPHAGRAR